MNTPCKTIERDFEAQTASLELNVTETEIAYN
jgi:hypothetical protein